MRSFTSCRKGVHHLFGFFILLVIISGCSKSSSDRHETRIEIQQIETVLNNQNFECASLGGQCPSGLARLFILNPKDPERSAVCTGFMVSATRLVTNHHCVSDAEECDNTYLAIFDGTNYQKAKCDSLIISKQDTANPNDRDRKLDFAVMNISITYQGEFLPLSQTSAISGDKVNAWVIDHTGLDKNPRNLLDARITEFQCEVKDQSTWKSLFMMNCPIISGNSGSPAINQSGEVIGVIWGGTSNNLDSSLDLQSRRSLTYVGLATEVKYFRRFKN